MHVQVNGIQIDYTDEGSGPPLLLVHGFPLSRGAWAQQVRAFKADFRVIAPDLRGMGGSEATPGTVSMADYAGDLHGLLLQMGLGPVTLAGHSMGGYIALAFAKAYPQALSRLLLVGTKAGADSAEAATARRTLAEQVRAKGISVVVNAMAPKMLAAGNRDPSMAAAVRDLMALARPEGVIAALLGMAERPDAGAWVGQIKAPTLVVTGEQDALIPPSEAEALAKAIPGAQLKRIAQAGHLVALEQPQAFNEALRTWLTQQ